MGYGQAGVARAVWVIVAWWAEGKAQGRRRTGQVWVSGEGNAVLGHAMSDPITL